MEIFTPKDFSQARTIAPYSRIYLTGLITFNTELVKKIGLSTGDRIAFVSRPVETDSHVKVQYGIAKHKYGFVLRRNKTSLQFNSRQLVNQLVEYLDLPLAIDRKKSVRFVMEKEEWEGQEVWVFK